MREIIIRFFDIIISLSAIIVLSPLLIATAFAVAVDIGLPFVFKQTRLGKGGRTFTIYKFRSMRTEPLCIEQHEQVNSYTIKVKDDPRISKVGHFIRKTSLDELPQLFNVLFGNMSIVGPRPFVPEEYKAFPSDWSVRLQTKPGITGLAQVRGRSDLLMEDIIRSDKEWIDNKSVKLYLSLIVRTILYILKMRNVY